MSRKQLHRILRLTRSVWDTDDFAPHTRFTFHRVLKCGTLELGGRIYRSSGGEWKIVYFSCKNKTCPSCGKRRTLTWIDDLQCRLPDTSYINMLFSMHQNLWSIFKENPNLLQDLTTIAVGTFQDWAKFKYGAEIVSLAILHTFGGDLKFYPHIHAIVSTTGLDNQGRLVSDIVFYSDQIKQAWRHSLVDYLRKLVNLGRLKSQVSREALHEMLDIEYDRLLIGRINLTNSKEHTLNYICRYARRPPISDRSILSFDESNVTFLAKDTKEKRRTPKTVPVRDFFKTLEQHISPPGCHTVHRYGLLGPRSRDRFAIYCAHLRHKTVPKRKALTWAELHLQTFGIDPLLDTSGQRMRPARFIFPQT